MLNQKLKSMVAATAVSAAALMAGCQSSEPDEGAMYSSIPMNTFRSPETKNDDTTVGMKAAHELANDIDMDEFFSPKEEIIAHSKSIVDGKTIEKIEYKSGNWEKRVDGQPVAGRVKMYGFSQKGKVTFLGELNERTDIYRAQLWGIYDGTKFRYAKTNGETIINESHARFDSNGYIIGSEDERQAALDKAPTVSKQKVAPGQSQQPEKVTTKSTAGQGPIVIILHNPTDAQVKQAVDSLRQRQK